ncbi:MAG TPA: glycine cleavage system aminomethyltransferase GcvT [Saprospiraceae bacterium]|nr:glycine cleavage system aminomethyltransferase GcvT [Saprospiraceae bacterium]HMQ84459.1 glycine cleavage system aminomethyltransferase GcvT [Saprospiraceae bacterium]
MKSTPLTNKHIALGAKMAEFAGFNMPISYAGIQEEHRQIREKVGVFDVSHMGEFIIKGKEALALVQQVTSNDASKLAIGEAQYSCFPNNEGGIVDDCLVYRLPEDQCAKGEQAFMLVVNASNIDKDWNWIQANNYFDTRMINISDQTGLLAVQGPLAVEALQSLTDIPLRDISYYTFVKGKFAGLENVLISATGYTGSGGFELYVDADKTERLWDAVFEAGAHFDIRPVGLGARDTLRLEMGYCLYGNDIDDTTSPIEAGLGWITKTQKESFINKDLFAAQRKNGTSRKLCGFILPEERRVPRHDYPIENESGDTIGKVTSGTLSPSLGYPVGMGYVEKGYETEGNHIYIVVGAKRLKATVTKPPFVKI